MIAWLLAAALSGWLVVPIPGSGLVSVEVTWSDLTYDGVFVLQGEEGPRRPCAELWRSLRCTVDAGPLTQIAVRYLAEPVTCQRLPRLQLWREGAIKGEVIAERPAGLFCAFAPVVGAP